MLLQPVSRAEHWLVSLALTLLFVLLLLALLLLGAGLGVRLGVVNGPSINLNVGLVRIVASTNQAPNCNPQDAACAALLRAGGAGPRYYSIWVVTTNKVVTSSGGPEQFGGTRVLALPAGP